MSLTKYLSFNLARSKDSFMLLMMNLFWRFEINLTLNFLWLKWTVGISISSTTLRAVLQSSEQADFKANLTIFEIGQVKTKGSLQKNKKSGFYPHRLDPPLPLKCIAKKQTSNFFCWDGVYCWLQFMVLVIVIVNLL